MPGKECSSSLTIGPRNSHHRGIFNEAGGKFQLSHYGDTFVFSPLKKGNIQGDARRGNN